jgi:hypothetical protein
MRKNAILSVALSYGLIFWKIKIKLNEDLAYLLTPF